MILQLMLRRLMLFGCFIFLLSGCDSQPERQQMVLEGKTMGTFYSIKLSADAHDSLFNTLDKTTLQREVDQLLEQINDDISTYRPESSLSRFNRYQGSEPQSISNGMADIILQALRIGKATHGAMDITVGPLVNLWGFGPQKQRSHTPNETEIAAARQQVGLQYLTLINNVQGAWLKKSRSDMYVDLSTLGEGYGADQLAILLNHKGITNYLVSVGGAVVSRGVNAAGEPWRIAIQKPTDAENAVQALVDLHGYGISTAGSYRNYYEENGVRYSHIIDPATGKPITHNLVSVTVIAPTATEADGWDSGLMVLGTEKALELARKEGLAVFLITKTESGFSTYMSPQFAAFLIPNHS